MMKMFFHESLVGNDGRKAKKNTRFISRTISFSVPEEFSWWLYAGKEYRIQDSDLQTQYIGAADDIDP